VITQQMFEERIAKLWKSQQTMAAPKKWKSGKRAGLIRRQAMEIEFNREQLSHWLWKRVGLNAVQCHYCKVPIDILNLTLDHAKPRTAGGAFSLDNMRICCGECNERKGNLSEQAFLAILAFSYATLSSYDRGVLMKRLAAAHHGSPARFFRKPEQKGPEPCVQESAF